MNVTGSTEVITDVAKLHAMIDDPFMGLDDVSRNTVHSLINLCKSVSTVTYELPRYLEDKPNMEFYAQDWVTAALKNRLALNVEFDNTQP